MTGPHPSLLPLPPVRVVGPALLIAGLAALLALPALRGEFVGGDDHRLILNHVLVHQPSFAHAAWLFKIVHRDLYQPLPLLTFQLEFLVGGWLHLFDVGPNGGAWLFHANNLLLHGLNAVLAYGLVWTIARIRHRPPDATPPRRSTLLLAATIAGVLFATHPFQTEVASWINGRMMLLSTAFALSAALALLRFLETTRVRWAILMLLCVLFCSLSKIRAPLPLLLGLVALASARPLDRRFWIAWIPACLLVVMLVVVNLQTTAEAALFAGGAEKLHGPRAVRVLLAVAFYGQHLIYPVGLNSYYPTPVTVSWSDPATLRAIVVVAVTAALLGLVAWKHPPCRFAVAWCALALADTLPFFPARNVLAADRYMYLPMVGVAWCAGEWIARRLGEIVRTADLRIARVVGVAVVLIFVMTGWRIADAYTTPLKKTRRTAALFPDTPRVWQRVGWCYERAGEHQRALEAAQRELGHDDDAVRSEALQLIGTAKIHLGRIDEGLAILRQAVTTDPASPAAKQQLGRAYDELGRFAEAVEQYEQAVAGAPRDDPTLRRLAMLYRRFARLDDARRLYQRVLVNNPFDPEAVIGLTELDIEQATADAYRSADERLTGLLEHLPQNQRLIANRDMVRFLSSRADENMKIAAQAFVALTDGRYRVAAARVEAMDGADSSRREARAWLRESIGQLSARRPDEPWTFGLMTRILIADGQRELAGVSLDLFERRCASPDCGEYARSLREMLSAGRPPPE